MNMVSTSLESYRQCVESGYIAERYMEIIEWMHPQEESVSQGDAVRHFSDMVHGYQARFHELEKLGVIQCVGTKWDEITKRNVKAYRLTGNLPAAEPTKGKKRTTKCPNCGHEF